MSSQKVLRKLEINEIEKNRSPVSYNSLITLRVRCKIDLFGDLSKLKAAIQTWKRMQTFLRAKVEKVNNELHFVIYEDSSANRNLENVHFLRIKSNIEGDLKKSLIEDGLLLKLLVERSLGQRFDFEKNQHELLWRMIILELKKDGNDELIYEFIWHSHHSIVDGISMKENFPLLMNIIYKTFRGEHVEVKDFGLYPGLEHLFKNEMQLKVEPTRLPKIVQPNFVNKNEAEKNARSYYDEYFEGRDIDKLDFDLIDLNTRESFTNLSEMIYYAKEINNIIPNFFFIDKNIFEEFLKKAKLKGIRMTSCLNLISAIAIFKLFKTHGDELKLTLFYNPVSLRQFKPEEISDFQLGFCAGSLFSEIPNEFDNVDDDSEIIAKIWPLAKRNAECFEKRVINDDSKFMKPPIPVFEENQIFVHYGLSNRGVMDTKKYECFGVDGSFEIENTFTMCHVSKEVDKKIFTIYLTTIGNKLCGSVCYNDFYFNHRFIDEYILHFKSIIHKLVI